MLQGADLAVDDGPILRSGRRVSFFETDGAGLFLPNDHFRARTRIISSAALGEVGPMASTTIQVSVEVRNELRTRGHVGETYDDVLRRLLSATRPRDAAGFDRYRRTTATSGGTLVRQEVRE